MAIGNQLDLQIIVNGYQQAQSALQQLSGSFGHLRDSAIEYTSAVQRYNNIANQQRQSITSVANSTEELITGLEETANSMSELGGEGAEVEEHFRDLEDSMQHVESSRARMTTGIMQTIGQLSAMGAMLSINVVSSLREASIEMEQLTIQLKTIGTVGEDTSESLERLVAISKLPGIDFQQAVKGVTQLRATGVSASLAEEAVRNLGNALASVGGDPQDLQGVIRAFTQIQSKGKVYAEEIYQIAERLPQIRKIMLDVIGTADTELLAKEGYSANQFLMMVTDGLGRLPKVADNTRNQLSNLKNEVFLLTSELGKELMPSLLDFLKGVNNVIASIRGWSDSTKSLMVGFVKWGGILSAFIALLSPFALALGAIASLHSMVALQTNISTIATSQQALAQQVQTVTSVEATAGQTALANANTAVAGTATVATGAITRMTWTIRALTATTIVGFLALLAGVVYVFSNWGKKTSEVKDEFTDLNSEIEKTRDLLAVASDIKRFTKQITEQQRALNNLNKELSDLRERKQNDPQGSANKELEKNEQNLQITADYAEERLQANMSLLLAEIEKAGLKWQDYAKMLPEGKYQMMIGEKAVNSANDWTEWWDKFGDDLHKNVTQRIETQNKLIKQIRTGSREKTKSLNKDFMYQFSIADEFVSVYEEIEGELVEAQKVWQEGNQEYISKAKGKNTASFKKIKEAKTTFRDMVENLLDMGDMQEIIPEKSLYDSLMALEGDNKDVAYKFAVSGQEYGKVIRKGNLVIVKNAKSALEALEAQGDTWEKTAKKLGINFKTVSLDVTGDAKFSSKHAIQVFVRGQEGLTDLYNMVGQYINEQANLDLLKESTLQGRNYQKYKQWYSDMGKVLDGQRKAKEASQKKLYDAVTSVGQLEGLMKSILEDAQTPLISSTIEQARILIQDDIRAEIEAWNSLQNLLLRKGTLDEDGQSRLSNLQLLHGKDKDVADILRIEEKLFNDAQEGNKIKLDVLDKILDLTESGLPEVAQVLIDANLAEKDKVEIINKYVEEMFAPSGKFNDKHIKSQGAKIEATVDQNRKYIEKITYGEGKQYDLTRYSRFKDPAKSMVILGSIVEQMEGGTEEQNRLLQNILASDALQAEIAIEKMNELQEHKQKLLKNLREASKLTPDSLAGQIIEATLDHQEVVRTMELQISQYLEKPENKEDQYTAQIRSRITEEKRLFDERIKNIRDASKEQKQLQKDNLQIMKNEVITLERQQALLSSSDPESRKIKQDEYKLEEDLAKVEYKRTALAREYGEVQKDINKALEEMNILEALGLKFSELQGEKLAEQIKKQTELFDEAEEGEEGKQQRIKAERALLFLKNVEFMRGKGIAEEELDIMVRKLNIQFLINKHIFEEKRIKDEIVNSAKHEQRMAQIGMKLDILKLKRKNKDGSKDIELINAEFNMKNKLNKMEQDHQVELQKEIETKHNKEKSENEEKLDALRKERGELEQQGGLLKKNTDKYKRLQQVNKEIIDLSAEYTKKLADNPGWKKIERQLEILKEEAKAFGVEWNIAMDSKEIKNANKEMQLMIKLIGKTAEQSKRMTDEVKARHDFTQKTGISADLFGLGEFGDASKFKEMKNQFKSFFDDFGDVEHLANLKNFNSELEAITNERNAISDNKYLESEDRLSKEADLLKRELDLYVDFNNSFRSSIANLKTLYDERHRAGMDYLSQRDQIAKDNEKLDIDAKYQGRNLSEKEESQRLKENILHNIKWIETGHNREMNILEQQKGMLSDDKDARLAHDRAVDLLKRKTALALKKELQTASAHNISLEGSEQNKNKNMNKLGSSVLKWRNGELERQRKYHRDVEQLERDHQVKMNEYAKQGDGSLADKAKRMGEMQEKLYHDRKKLDEDFAKSQSDAKDQLYRTLKGSHTKKGGEQFELDPAIKAMIENLTALMTDELGKVPKTVEQQMQEWKKGYQPEKRGKKGGWFFGIGGKTDAILQEYQAGVLDWHEMLKVSGTEMDDLYTAIKDKMGLQFDYEFGRGGEEDIEKVMTMLAQFKVMGLTYKKFQEMYPEGSENIESIEDIKKKYDDRLNQLQQEREAREQKKIEAEKAQVKRINDVNTALAGLGEGEGSKLAIFGLAIDSVTKKLGELKRALDNPPGSPSGNGNGQPPAVNVNINGMFDLDKNGEVIFNRMIDRGQSGISPSFGYAPFGTANRNHRFEAKILGNQLGSSRGGDMFVSGDEINNVLNENRTTIIHNTYNNSSSSGDPG